MPDAKPHHLDQLLHHHGLVPAGNLDTPTSALAHLLLAVLQQSTALHVVQQLQSLSSMTPGEALELCHQLGLDDATDAIPLTTLTSTTRDANAELTKYLLAATFRDCSIMINLHLEGTNVTAAVVVVDVEPKP
jgi:hypothetical protein